DMNETIKALTLNYYSFYFWATLSREAVFWLLYFLFIFSLLLARLTPSLAYKPHLNSLNGCQVLSLTVIQRVETLI
ncbi:hypothetical protein ACWE42_25640, partial [Sutcliffiella cohnii]